ncbi:MAG: hypothetical protein ACTHKG_00205 [Nocardioides sp.]
MKRTFAVGAAVIGFTLVGSVPAHAARANWGPEVKACNQTSCYPGGTSRGGYVSAQARDVDAPGYASEIHQVANPGHASPPGLGE